VVDPANHDQALRLVDAEHEPVLAATRDPEAN
jgi:hypothetical protein